MAANTDLGELILMLNPYLNATLPETALKIDGIDIYCRNPNPVAAPHPAPAATVAEISYKLDGPYAQEWNFRNQPQKVGMDYASASGIGLLTRTTIIPGPKTIF